MPPTRLAVALAPRQKQDLNDIQLTDWYGNELEGDYTTKVITRCYEGHLTGVFLLDADGHGFVYEARKSSSIPLAELKC